MVAGTASAYFSGEVQLFGAKVRHRLGLEATTTLPGLRQRLTVSASFGSVDQLVTRVIGLWPIAVTLGAGESSARRRTASVASLNGLGGRESATRAQLLTSRTLLSSEFGRHVDLVVCMSGLEPKWLRKSFLQSFEGREPGRTARPAHSVVTTEKAHAPKAFTLHTERSPGPYMPWISSNSKRIGTIASICSHA